jgi:aryl-alcohol dehydrogenase (NADP+)
MCGQGVRHRVIDLSASEIVEAQWVAERRGLALFRTEQLPHSILNRSIEQEVLPVCQKYGMDVLVWSPLAKGMLTSRYRKGHALPESLRVKVFPKQMSDERNLETVERLIPIAEQAGLSLTHMAMAFVMAHRGVTSAIPGPRTMQQLDDLLAGAEVVLDDEIMDWTDKVVAPGIDAGRMGAIYAPAVTLANLRRRPLPDRAAPDRHSELGASSPTPVRRRHDLLACGLITLQADG